MKKFLYLLFIFILSACSATDEYSRDQIKTEGVAIKDLEKYNEQFNGLEYYNKCKNDYKVEKSTKERAIACSNNDVTIELIKTLKEKSPRVIKVTYTTDIKNEDKILQEINMFLKSNSLDEITEDQYNSILNTDELLKKEKEIEEQRIKDKNFKVNEINDVEYYKSIDDDELVVSLK